MAALKRWLFTLALLVVGPACAAEPIAPAVTATATPASAAVPTNTPVPAPTIALPRVPTAAPAAATPSSAPRSSPTLPLAEQPRRGGTLVLYQPSPFPSLDIGQETTAYVQQHVTSAYNTLLRVDPKGLPQNRVVVADLAREWNISQDASQVTFRLREGVRFHDGQPFTSADVKATLERLRDRIGGVRAPFGQYLKGSIVETPDPLTITVKFPAPSPLILELFASPSMSIMPKHVLEKDPRALEKTTMGTGPFKFSKLDPGIQWQYVRNDDYWEKGKPHLDGIRWLQIPEPTTQVAAFRAGRVNMTGFATRGLSPIEAEQIQRQVPGVTLQRYVGASLYLAMMNTRVSPFDKVQVRRAVALALDQQELIDIGYEKAGFKSDYTGPVGLPWSMPQQALNQNPIIRGVGDADLAKAKGLLAEAGFPGGLNAEFLIGNQHAQFAPVPTEQLRRIGIRATVRVRDRATEFIPETRAGKFQIAWGGISMSFYDPSLALAPFVRRNPDNVMGYENNRVEDLYKRLSSTADPTLRKRLSDEIQTIVWEDVPAVPAPAVQYILGIRPEVQGWTHPGILRDNFRFEDVWLRP